ncbi:MAG: ATP-binding cassette domain-containing protein [Desulfobacteraceae bacterium]|nr:ATP-binding cassette domain-containing protein [Desulfobacteraceae bacterium]
MTQDNYVIKIKGLRHRRAQAGVTFELRVPELTLFEGEFAALVGPSGCGKSTLLDILGLVLKPLHVSEFFISGQNRSIDLTGLGEMGRACIRSRHLGYVLQTGGLLPFLTVRQNIGLPLRLIGDRDNAKVATVAEALNIGEQLDKRPAFLSGGQRQRVAIARALVHGPKIVLADEPTAAVDELTAVEIRDQLRDLSRSTGTTTIMVTHDKSLLRDRVDRVFSFRLKREEAGLTTSILMEVESL